MLQVFIIDFLLKIGKNFSFKIAKKSLQFTYALHNFSKIIKMRLNVEKKNRLNTGFPKGKKGEYSGKCDYLRCD